MAGIYIYSEEQAVAEQLLTAGKTLASSLNEKINVIDFNEQDSESFIKKGADHVLCLKSDHPWPESYAQIIADILKEKDPTVVLIGGTLRGKTTASIIAAKLQTGLVNNAFAIEGSGSVIETKRIMYSGIAVCTEELCHGSIVTIEPRTFDAAQDSDHQGDTENIDIQPEAKTITVGNVCPIVHQDNDIATAEKLVCVGRGLSDQNDMKLAEELAEKLHAQICCTRSVAEDYHWLTTDKYVGLSGAKVKPNLYISMGVSGQVQHVAGMRDSKVIVAVDTNENAPIFAAADYGIVGDLHEIIPLLTKELG